MKSDNREKNMANI